MVDAMLQSVRTGEKVNRDDAKMLGMVMAHDSAENDEQTRTSNRCSVDLIAQIVQRSASAMPAGDT